MTSVIKKEAVKDRNAFESKVLLEYKVLRINDCASSISEVNLFVSFEHIDKQYNKEITLRFIYEGMDGEMLIIGETGGQWKFIENFFDQIEYSN